MMNESIKSKRQTHQWQCLTLGLIAVLGLLSGCTSTIKIPEVPERTESQSSQNQVIQLSPEQEQALNLKVESVKATPLALKLQTTGEVDAINDRMSHSYSPVMGQVVSVSTAIGESVTKGQVLARLRSDQVGQLQSAFLTEALQIQAEQKQAQVELNLSKIKYDRETKLFNERISPRADLEAARAQYEKEQAAIQTLQDKWDALLLNYKARLSLYGADPGVVSRVLKNKTIEPYISIIAPRNGILINRGVNQGELVDTSKEMFTIADLSRVWLTANIYEKDVPLVFKNQPVLVKLDSLPNTAFQGNVSFVGTILNPETRTLEVRSEVANPKLLLKPNMFARVEINIGNKKTLAVPNEAIQRTGDYSFIYLSPAPHQYIEKQVTLGVTSGLFTEILDGVQINEQIVTYGTLALKGEVQKMNANAKNK